MKKMNVALFRILRTLFLWTSLSFGLFSTQSLAAGVSVPLLADQAFQVSAVRELPNKLLILFNIAPGYYLYAERVHVVLPPNVSAHIVLPQGEFKYDAAGARSEIYSGHLNIPVLFEKKDQPLSLRVDYQGCSQEGFCYPPIQKTLQLNLSDGAVVTEAHPVQASGGFPSAVSSLLTNQNGVQALFHTMHPGMMLLVFAGLGLLLAFTPCVWPMIPILTSIIVGQKSVNVGKAFLLSLTYVLGTAITYAFAGLIAARIGNTLQVMLQQPSVIFFMSSLFVLLALALFGGYDLSFPRSFNNRVIGLSGKQQGGTYAGVFVMGMLSTLILSPCVSAPLVGVLMYIGQTGNLILGAGALFAMGMGMGAPLLLIGTSAGKWLPQSGPWMGVIKKLFGILMLGMAIWLVMRVEWPNSTQSVATAHSFSVVHNMEDLNRQLLMAQAARRPVLLDFYADWCESCVEMDHKVFKLPEVQMRLAPYVLLRADLSANSNSDEVMLKYFNVIAPPTVLYFDANGREMDAMRIVGEVSAKEFLARLKGLKTY